MRTAKACCCLESEVRWRGEAIEGSDIWRAANGECRLAIGGWRLAMASDEWRLATGEWRVENWRLALGQCDWFTLSTGVANDAARVI